MVYPDFRPGFVDGQFARTAAEKVVFQHAVNSGVFQNIPDKACHHRCGGSVDSFHHADHSSDFMGNYRKPGLAVGLNVFVYPQFSVRAFFV